MNLTLSHKALLLIRASSRDCLVEVRDVTRVQILEDIKLEKRRKVDAAEQLSTLIAARKEFDKLAALLLIVAITISG